MLPPRPLGRPGLHVSVLSIGSWVTFEHLPMETGVATMVAAREFGIEFLDDARYDDRTGRAPIPTGYSEVVFGELFRAAGFRRVGAGSAARSPAPGAASACARCFRARCCSTRTVPGRIPSTSATSSTPSPPTTRNSTISACFIG